MNAKVNMIDGNPRDWRSQIVNHEIEKFYSKHIIVNLSIFLSMKPKYWLYQNITVDIDFFFSLKENFSKEILMLKTCNQHSRYERDCDLKFSRERKF